MLGLQRYRATDHNNNQAQPMRTKDFVSDLGHGRRADSQLGQQKLKSNQAKLYSFYAPVS
jgi:hypothetical protein